MDLDVSYLICFCFFTLFLLLSYFPFSFVYFFLLFFLLFLLLFFLLIFVYLVCGLCEPVILHFFALSPEKKNEPTNQFLVIALTVQCTGGMNKF